MLTLLYSYDDVSYSYNVFLLYSFDLDPRTRHTVWSLIIGGTLSWLCNIGVTQSSVQRFSSVPTFRASQLWVNKLLLTAVGAPYQITKIFIHLKLWIATNFKWVKTTRNNLSFRFTDSQFERTLNYQLILKSVTVFWLHKAQSCFTSWRLASHVRVSANPLFLFAWSFYCWIAISIFHSFAVGIVSAMSSCKRWNFFCNFLK